MPTWPRPRSPSGSPTARPRCASVPRTITDLTRPDLIERLRAAGCVFAEDEADLLLEAAGSPDELAAMLARRVEGLPLEQVVGWAEFCSLRIVVEPGVFVPRRRTQLLARTAVRLLTPGSVVVDLCCGTGAVGAALLASGGPMEVHAVDIDPAATHCAARNLAVQSGQVHTGDLFSALPTRLRERIDLAVANAPYVPTDAIAMMPAEARVHEPRAALDGGDDGLDVQRRIAAQAEAWVRPGGYLLIETSEEQSSDTIAAFARHGFTTQVETDEDLDATVVVGRRG